MKRGAVRTNILLNKSPTAMSLRFQLGEAFVKYHSKASRPLVSQETNMPSSASSKRLRRKEPVSTELPSHCPIKGKEKSFVHLAGH